jgi:hypothetical protein
MEGKIVRSKIIKENYNLNKVIIFELLNQKESFR